MFATISWQACRNVRSSRCRESRSITSLHLGDTSTSTKFCPSNKSSPLTAKTSMVMRSDCWNKHAGNDSLDPNISHLDRL